MLCIQTDTILPEEPVAGSVALSPFEENYIGLRKREARLYTDEELAQLPLVPSDHAHYREWRMRSQSCHRLLAYLRQQHRTLNILEVGCGNGWLSKQLATLPVTTVLGSDVTLTELSQAAVVFSTVPNLHFIGGDIRSGLFREKSFDTIVFAASIQYFPSLTGILDVALPLLKTAGELHILDSCFYRSTESVKAKERSADYYQRTGFPAMSDHYFHHCFSGFSGYRYRLLYKPSPLHRLFSSNPNPFPWICLPQQ